MHTRTRVPVSLMPLALAALFAAGCNRPPSTPPAAAGTTAGFQQEGFLSHVRTLSSDEFEGRAPGTPGEDRTVAYIAGEFQRAGLSPGAPDGTFFQPVPLVGVTGRPGPLVLRKGASKHVLQVRDDFVAWSKRTVESSALGDSPIVFAGYGVAAPEFQWDDFRGVDLAGKTLIVLAGDPPVPDPANPGVLDPHVFAGQGMTYYGRWPYKLEEAAARHAAGIFIVHETEAAGYPFSVVQGRLGEQYDLEVADRNMSRPAVEGWITLDQARALFAMAGHDYAEMKRRAVSREFRPVPLGVTASVTVRNTMRPVASRNVVGRLPGRDPAVADECVVFTAHWDHFGPGTGDVPPAQRVLHGALDNASGVAGLIEMARAFGRQAERPRRGLVFVAVTAEEQLMLGSEFYARHPVCPLDRTLAALNFEMMNPWGPTRDLIAYGLGMSDLDDHVRAAAAARQRTVRPDPEPERGWYYRSDHFPFARRGVPALWIGGGDDYVGQPAGFGRRKRDEYNTNSYHKPSDVIQADWNVAGALADLGLYFEVASRVANGDRYPEWRPGAEFKAARDAMLAGRKTGR